MPPFMAQHSVFTLKAESRQLAELKIRQTESSRVALIEGLKARSLISDGGIMLNKLGPLEALFERVVEALDEENDFLRKELLGDGVPSPAGGDAPPHSINTNPPSSRQNAIERGVDEFPLENAHYVPPNRTQAIESLQTKVSENSSIANKSTSIDHIDNSLLGNKSTTSKQSHKPPKNPARFSCTVCGKRFTRSTTLREHARSHSNERPFECSLCPKKFARLKDKKRHHETHLDEKEFICKGASWSTNFGGCSRNFAREDGLLAHWRTETGWGCLTENLGSEIEAYEKKLEHLHRLVHNYEGSFHCAEAIADMTPGNRKIRQSHYTECQKSYASARDLWDKHFGVDEGKECLKALLLTQALYLSQIWATAAKLDSWSNASERLTRTNQEHEEEMENSISLVYDGDYLRDSEWRVLSCDYDMLQPTTYVGQFAMSIRLRAPFEMDPEEVSFHFSYTSLNDEIHDRMWTKDYKECILRWEIRWQNIHSVDTRAALLLKINSRKKGAIFTLGMLAVENNRGFGFAPAHFIPSASKNLRHPEGHIEDLQIETWKVLACKYDIRMEIISICLAGIPGNLIDLHFFSRDQVNIAFHIVFGAAKDATSQRCAWNLSFGELELGLECDLSGFLLADSTSDPALPCFLKIQYNGKTDIRSLGKVTCRDGYLVGFNPFYNVAPPSRLANSAGQPSEITWAAFDNAFPRT